MVDAVEYELKDFVMEIPSKEIGEKVLNRLFDIDQVAYIRFASVYRNFSDLDSFVSACKKLKARSKRGKKVIQSRRGSNAVALSAN